MIAGVPKWASFDKEVGSSIITDLWGKLLYSDVDAKGSIQAHPTGLQEAHEMGRRAVSEAWSEA